MFPAVPGCAMVAEMEEGGPLRCHPLSLLPNSLVLSIPMPAFRAVQGEVTAEPALHVYAHGEACRPDEGRIDIGAGCPLLSMVRESYGCIIGDAPTGGAPVW